MDERQIQTTEDSIGWRRCTDKVNEMCLMFMMTTTRFDDFDGFTVTKSTMARTVLSKNFLFFIQSSANFGIMAAVSIDHFAHFRHVMV
jgi:hypothetical protein